MVENTCHLERDSDDEPWHLEIQVGIDAEADEVAQILQAEGVAVARDREPMLVQQEPDDPAGGWNGALGPSRDGGSFLGLTYNNVALDGLPDAGGWAEVCRAADLE